MKRIRLSSAVVCLLLLWSVPAAAQFDDVEIKVEHIAGNIHMIEGRGGKLAICVGDDGAFLVDDQFAPLTEKILAAIGTLDTEPVRFVFNTHWHFDHTGGNENFGNAGALIVAHHNVRQRMSTKQFIEFVQRESEPQPAAALPVVTFTDEVRFHLNGEDIMALHLSTAHTDGDAVVLFRNANVLHGGDIYWGGMYPFIDLSSGGSIDGIIDATLKMLALVDDDTKVIPGHGPVGGRAELQAFHDMLKGVRAAVQPLVARGASLEETIEKQPLAAFDETWGQGWIKTDQMVEFVYKSLSE